MNYQEIQIKAKSRYPKTPARMNKIIKTLKKHEICWEGCGASGSLNVGGGNIV